ERVVALTLPRSVDLVVAMLAVWKAGGVYLPVDPDLPADRVGFLLDDAGPALVLSTVDDLGAGYPESDPTDADRAAPLGVGNAAGRRTALVAVTPSFAQPLLEAGVLADDRYRPPILMLGGEAIGESLWRELSAVEGTTSYNFYGPTECTVDALSCRVGEVDRPGVGRPSRNLRACALESALRPVPVGRAGGLYPAGGPVGG